MSTEEEQVWVKKAAEADDGRGLALEEYDPDVADDMEELYEKLELDGTDAERRLKRFIRRLRVEAPPRQKQQPPPPAIRLERLQQPPPAMMRLDTTVAWASQVSVAVTADQAAAFVDGGNNSIHELSSFLKSFPSPKALVEDSQYNFWRTVVPAEELQRYFVPAASTNCCCKALVHIVTGLLLYPMPIVGENEKAGYHSRIDQCVAKAFALFAPQFQLSRHSSSQEELPDFGAFIVGKTGCFFRGEEKILDYQEHDPVEELYYKLGGVCPFPGFPFVLGYASVGATITFCRVSSQSAGRIPNLTLDLNTVQGRLECFNVIRNVSRIMKYIHGELY